MNLVKDKILISGVPNESQTELVQPNLYINPHGEIIRNQRQKVKRPEKNNLLFIKGH